MPNDDDDVKRILADAGLEDDTAPPRLIVGGARKADADDLRKTPTLEPGQVWMSPGDERKYRTIELLPADDLHPARWRVEVSGDDSSGETTERQMAPGAFIGMTLLPRLASEPPAPESPRTFDDVSLDPVREAILRGDTEAAMGLLADLGRSMTSAGFARTTLVARVGNASATAAGSLVAALQAATSFFGQGSYMEGAKHLRHGLIVVEGLGRALGRAMGTLQTLAVGGFGQIDRLVLAACDTEKAESWLPVGLVAQQASAFVGHPVPDDEIHGRLEAFAALGLLEVDDDEHNGLCVRLTAAGRSVVHRH